MEKLIFESNNNLTKNNIEKIKKSIDCLKNTIKRSNSHLFLNKDNPFNTIYNNGINDKKESPLLQYRQRQNSNIYKNYKNSSKFSNIINNNNKNLSSPKSSNNINFYNINITNNNDKNQPESIESLSNPQSTFRNKFYQTANPSFFRNNSTKNISTVNDKRKSLLKMNKDKIKESIQKLENTNKELKVKYEKSVENYESSNLIKSKIRKNIFNMTKKLKLIQNINSKIKNKIENTKIYVSKNDYMKEKRDLLTKYQELKKHIVIKDNLILDLKKQINNAINGENKTNFFDEIINKNNEIMELKNKIKQFNVEISKQEEEINKILTIKCNNN